MTDVAIQRTTDTLPKRVLSKPKLKWMLAAACAGFLTLAGVRYAYDWWTIGQFIESTDDAYIGGNVTSISPHVAGFVAEILADDNAHVRAGQLLIRLDDRDFRVAVDHAAAVVSERRASLAGLQARELLQQSTIRQAQADLAAKLAEATFAKEDDERYRQLAQSTAGTRQTAERALASDKAAQSAAASAQAGLESAQQQLEVLRAQIAEAGAALAQAQADLQTAELALSYTEIRSPIDGYVSNRAAQIGTYVSAGAYLLTIIPSHELWIEANFKEDQLARMAPGQAASIVADVLPGHVFRGHVLSLARGTGAIFSVIPPENATGNFTKIVQRVPVRIALDPDNTEVGVLRPGLSTTANVDVRSVQGRAP